RRRRRRAHRGEAGAAGAAGAEHGRYRGAGAHRAPGTGTGNRELGTGNRTRTGHAPGTGHVPSTRTPGTQRAPALAAASPGGDECLEEDEDELEPGLDEAEAEPEVAKAAGAARGAVLTRRGITLRVLLRDGLLEPGRGVLSIYYLGKKFVGDLGLDGTITWQETGQVFNSPSAWATHCKRLVNPAKKSGCGWASVRYKGQKLDQYKAAWLRKHQPNVRPPEESLASEGEEEELPEDEEEEAAREGRVAVPEPAAPKKPEERSKKQQGKGPAEPAGTDGGSAGKRPEVKPRVPVRYCTLGTRDSARNPQTLVEVTSFAAINKFQPFNVAISSNVLLLLDFHSHLTRSEVVGYLGGRWDTNTQLLTVLRAFPCRTRLGDARSRGRCGGGGEGQIQPGGRAGGSGGSGPTVCAPPDLPEPVPAGAVAGGVVPQPPLRAHAAVAARHRCADGLPAQAAGQWQRLPALPGAHLRYVSPPGLPGGWGCCRPPVPAPSVPTGPFYHGNPGVESKIAPFWVMPPPEVQWGRIWGGVPPPGALGCPRGGVRCQSCGVTPARLPHPPATAQRLRDPHGCGGHLHPGRIPHQRCRAGDGERRAGAPQAPRAHRGQAGAPPLVPILPLALVMVTVPSPAPPRPRCRRFGVPLPGFGAPPGLQPLCPPQTLLVEFYKGAPDLVKFQELWSQDQTYLDKLKVGRAAKGGGFAGAPIPCAGTKRGSPLRAPWPPAPPKTRASATSWSRSSAC
uniref:Uncharacterized protein n=1 Tax=Geospiza parvula TaxID=87175 RepID=A0A8C3NNE6_GEOPR